MSRAFKIMDRADWARLDADGRWAGSAVDLADGYVHLSTDDQLAGTAAKHYAGRDGLVLAEVDLDRAGDVRFEPSRGGALFPHIYGELTRACVVGARTASVDGDGVLRLGETLA